MFEEKRGLEIKVKELGGGHFGIRITEEIAGPWRILRQEILHSIEDVQREVDTMLSKYFKEIPKS